jgi:hypothetical protein
MLTREAAIAQLQASIEEGRSDEVMQFFVEFLAEWGPEHIDVQALAERVLDRANED